MFIYSRNLQWIIFCILFFLPNIHSDNFNYNSFNNHGVIGLINIPTARFYDEGSFGFTLYDGTPDQKMTMTSSPYDWMEASFFYMNLQGEPYPGYEYQDLKDKGFNFKIRLKKEGALPAIAIGINDIAGTGYYSSEYIVGSYGIGNLDMHLGLGWGTLNGSDKSFKNPLTYIHSSFANRPNEIEDSGGQFQPSRYFSSKSVSPFYGISYALNNKLLIKLEHDPTLTDGLINYQSAASRYSFGLDYTINKNFTIGISNERDNYFSLRFVYKKDSTSTKKAYEYKKANVQDGDNKYTQLIKNLESNGIGVNRIIETADNIGIEITQFSHPNLDIVEDILYSAKRDSGIKKDIKTDYRIADLKVFSNIDEDNEIPSNLVFKRKTKSNFNTNSRLSVRPYLAAREGFFKFAIMAENDSEYVIKDNLFFTSNIKYTIKDNFEDLTLPPYETYPAQVRSDVKEYLRNFENRFIIGRAQLDYHLTPKKNNHIMFTAGIIEEMFSGYGFEYLYFDKNKDYAVGVEIFHVKKRDYNLRFGSLDYKNTTGFLNFYYRNNYLVPFDAKVSHGEYLAGDIGTTFELSRAYMNGAKFGIFASFTDVNATQFGEGSFDKGIFFNIPIYKNFVEYSWRPLTKDPGARLVRKYTLHDLLIKFKPYNK